MGSLEHRALVLLGAAWLALMLSGLAGLTDYAARPGEVGELPRSWPEVAAGLRDPARPTLVVALHPRCACSRASVEGLARLLARAFGARTSGQALPLDRASALRASGGLTPARGHVGETAAADAIVAIALGDGSARASGPVFGCALFDAPAGVAERR